ncbi:uncharacterized protein LOC131240182 [Magnolia sinica]|uniref:uncharacterized protein LOC131240182 n=1 Tax=Magnolia sinica TaxID=86752 RepID=UPI00265AF952|nr:uncharacterized protein LOC131240182 [Magnolia sinica]
MGSWAAMDAIRSQPTPDGTQRSEPEILSEVLGTSSGYVRGLGYGVKLMAPARVASNRSVVGESTIRRADIAEKEVQHLRGAVDEIKYQLARQREEHERQKEEQERQREEQERRMEDMRVKHERRMQEILQVLVARLPINASPPLPSSDAPPPPPSSL